MSEHDEPIRDWSAPDYLRDFINTHLILTFEEEEILDFLCDKYRGLPVTIPRSQYRTCKRCGEIKLVSDFEGFNTICRECRRKELYDNRKNNKS